jgi:DNA-binding NtrC family response regulator
MRSRVVGVPASVTRRRPVLVASDDETLLRVYARVLGRSYDVLLAADAREAMDLLVSGAHADAALIDFAGSEVPVLATWLAAHRPELAKRIVLVSDDAEILRRHEALAAMSPRLLAKPTPSSSLVAALEAALGA